MNQKLMRPWTRLPKGAELAVIRSLLAAWDSPRSLAVWLLFQCGTVEAHEQLLLLEPATPRPFESVDSFRVRYAATKLFSKSKGLRTSWKKDQVAIQTAAEAEKICDETNKAWESFRQTGACLYGNGARLRNSAILRIRSLIRKILGPCPSIDRIIAVDGGWSSGRDSSVYGMEKTALHKYNGRLDVTPRCLQYATSMLRASPAWGAAALDSSGPCSVLHSAFTYVPGNTMTVVPKNAKTDRVICYEPHANIRLQLAVGSILKQRLLKAGCNLRDQSINQRLAKLASKTGHLATIDLKSASDTLARETVYGLLPSDWVDLLDDLRSKQTLWPDGVTRKNHKFSSMGNGYTFELESLVFFAVCKALGCSTVSVYGDDIIVDTEKAADVISALNALGFLVNGSKTFTEGNFRESCGLDAYFGSSVTPVYLRDCLRTVDDVIHLHNAVRRWFGSAGAPIRGARLLAKWRARYPSNVGPGRSRGVSYGDDWYHVSLDEVDPISPTEFCRRRPKSSKVGPGWEGWVVSGYTRLYTDYHWSPEAVPESFGYAALCATTGPDAIREESSMNRFGRFRYIRYIGVVPSWDDYVWV